MLSLLFGESSESVFLFDKHKQDRIEIALFTLFNQNIKTQLKILYQNTTENLPSSVPKFLLLVLTRSPRALGVLEHDINLVLLLFSTVRALCSYNFDETLG